MGPQPSRAAEAGAQREPAGKRCTKDGTDAVPAFRSCILSGRYEDFWAWHAEDRLAASASAGEWTRRPACVGWEGAATTRDRQGLPALTPRDTNGR